MTVKQRDYRNNFGELVYMHQRFVILNYGFCLSIYYTQNKFM